MKISAKTEYACLAMMELATHYAADQPVRIRALADAHAIPSRFLVQILLQLKNAGLVSSTRGASGGYQLARDPATISLGSIMAIIEGRQASLDRDPSQATPALRALLSVWQEVTKVEHQALDRITLLDLVERQREEDGNMYFI